MLFSSTLFLFIFLPVTLLIYYLLLKKRHPRNLFLLAASIVFYAWGEPWYILILLASIVCNWIFGLLVDRYREEQFKARLIIVIMLVFNFSNMFVFKYFMFTLKNINFFFDTSIPIPYIVLPLGISFFTFQTVSYVIDIYRNDAVVQKNLLDVALYILLFPHMLAGPIVRYKTIAEEINHRIENYSDFIEGIRRFVIGLGKKVLIANNMALVADTAFSMQSGEMSMAFAWIGAFAYAFQIFFDFSGYSDMAIGLARMFGFHFQENFNFPYIARSISDFWRRWHISLSSWFRDYVYFPLGGSRVDTRRRLIFNLLVVWSLTGLWHGANWTFIFWGLFYFVLLSIEKLTNFDKLEKFNILRRVYVILAILIGWVFFRSQDLGSALGYLNRMFNPVSGPLIDPLAVRYLQEYAVIFAFAVLFSVPVWGRLKDFLAKKRFAKPMAVAAMAIILLLSISSIINSTYSPFIYFNF